MRIWLNIQAEKVDKLVTFDQVKSITINGTCARVEYATGKVVHYDTTKYQVCVENIDNY